MTIATRSKELKASRRQPSPPAPKGVAEGVDITATIERVVEGLGYRLVDLEAANHAALLRVFIERADADVNDPNGRINVRDCELVTRQLQQVFAVEDVDYGRLEVSSPGLDRVLKTAADFRRFVGFDAELRLRIPRGVRRRFVGVLHGASDTKVELVVEGTVESFALDELDKARLIPKL
jgi:ribosome maturation factor RimP